VKQDESDGDPKFTMIIRLGGKSSNHKRQIKYNVKNGEEYARLTKPPYRNLMLDRRVLKTKERPTWHKWFLPQKVV